MGHALVSGLTKGNKDFLLSFSARSSIVLGFTFKYMIHFKLTFMYDIYI